MDAKSIVLTDSHNTKESIINLYKAEFNFPPYAWESWDSFEDCLSDVIHLADGDVMAYHAGLGELPREDLLVYIDILFNLAKSCAKFKPVFNVDFVKTLLNHEISAG